MNSRSSLVVAISIVSLAITGCGSGSSHTAGPTTAPPATTAAPTARRDHRPGPTTGAVAAGAPACRRWRRLMPRSGLRHRADPHRIEGGGILCKYTGSGGISAVAIYAAQTATVFAGMVSNADDKVTGMQPVSGVGSGAFFLTAGGTLCVNAYSNGAGPSWLPRVRRRGPDRSTGPGRPVRQLIGEHRPRLERLCHRAAFVATCLSRPFRLPRPPSPYVEPRGNGDDQGD